jgi:hypothetical protein
VVGVALQVHDWLTGMRKLSPFFDIDYAITPIVWDHIGPTARVLRVFGYRVAVIRVAP